MHRIAILAAAAAAGCAGASRAPGGGARGPSPGDFFPLAVGNEWVYLDRSPALPASARPPERRVRILERTRDGFFRDSERGELRADPDCLRDRSRRLLCLPLEVGNAWVSVTGVSATERYEIAAVGERVETAAGVFRGCVRVRAHLRASGGAENVLELTYAPGVGPVRIETYAVVDGKVAPQVTAELRSYSLKKR
ncbi:MAG TPA: hypothetical protein VH880_13070 [Anaeromyxobacteraceae bacterium]